MRSVKASRDKTARFLVAVAKAESGKVWLPRSASWTRDAVAELTAFPKGGHDDLCDALAYSIEVIDDLTSYHPLPPVPAPKPKPLLLPGKALRMPQGWQLKAPPGWGK